MPELKTLTIPQLKSELQALNVKFKSNLKKAELIDLLSSTLTIRATEKVSVMNKLPPLGALGTLVVAPLIEKKKVTIKKIVPDVSDATLLSLRSRATGLEGACTSNVIFTEYLRAAHFFPELAEEVMRRVGHSGVPIRNGFNFKPVQIEALNFMRDRENRVEPWCGIRGGMLMLNMGVGKTLTGAAYSLTRTRPGATRTPTLVVCTKILVDVWFTEINKFFSGVKVLRFHTDFIKPKEFDEYSVSTFDEYDFVVTTYEFLAKHSEYEFIEEETIVRGEEHTIMNGRKIETRARTNEDIDAYATTGFDIFSVTGAASLFFKKWERILFDESQSFSSTKAGKFKSVMCLVGRYKWCLTGTPFKNKAEDVFAQFRAIGYIGGDENEIDPHTGEPGIPVHSLRDWEKGAAFKRDRLEKVIFSKEDESTVLPAIHRHTVDVNFTPAESRYYDEIAAGMNRAINGFVASTITFSEILVLFVRLRQSTISPFLIGDKLSTASAGGVTTNDYVNTLIQWSNSEEAKFSSKFHKVVNIIKDLNENEQVVLFSSFNESLELLGEFLNVNNISYAKISGDVKTKDRDQIIADFKSGTNAPRVLLLTYKVGSEGLTLTNANHVILLDPWWSDAVHQQAIARVHRTGQQREVHVHQLVNTNTFEENMISMCENKNKESEGIFNLEAELQTSNGLKSTGLNFKMIKDIVTKAPARELDSDDEGDVCYFCHEEGLAEGDKFINTGCVCNKLIHASCFMEIVQYNSKGGVENKCTICKKKFNLKK